jgi:hypothetical protein
MSQKKDKNELKTLTVEDLAGVVGGLAVSGTTEEGNVKVGGETKFTQRESRYPADPILTF